MSNDGVVFISKDGVPTALLKEIRDGKYDIASMKDMLKRYTVCMHIDGMTRLDSLLLCECDPSITQQSQRYVKASHVTDASDDTEESMNDNHIVDSMYELYGELITLKDDVNLKGRPTASDCYLYGVPPEDARYILPLGSLTNVHTTITLDKFVDFVLAYAAEGLEMPNYIINSSYTTKSIYKGVMSKLDPTLIQLSEYKFDSKFIPATMATDNSFNLINVLGVSKRSMYGPCNGAVTSSSEGSSIGDVDSRDVDEINNLVLRVCNYGHTSILEHAVFTFSTTQSLVSYHQFIRHRTINKRRPRLSDILTYNSAFCIPVSIDKGSKDMRSRYTQLACIAIEKATSMLRYDMDPETLRKALLMVPQALIINTDFDINLRAAQSFLPDRLCCTAQAEISIIAGKIISAMSSYVPEKVLTTLVPPCVLGKPCKEGKLSCGKTKDELKGIFKEKLGGAFNSVYKENK